jgi:cytochrome c oxidase subunit II
MNLGDCARAAGTRIKAFGAVIGLSLALLSAPSAAAQAAAAPPPAAPAPAPVESPTAPALTAPGAEPTSAAASPAAVDAAAAPAAGGYVPMKPTPGKGMPVDGGLSFQDQYSDLGEYALWFHDAILLPLIIAISLLVLFLLLWVVARYRRSANTVPSKTTHNTFIEVVWTLVPVLILVLIAIPSITLLARQFEPAPARALTIKATGYQWYWGYTYPDNGGFEVIANMLPEDEARRRGEPDQLASDFRMVVPVGEPIRVQVTGADVIHAFGVPSLWFKIDAVPGRINEKVLVVKEPGVYYGQCMELCGARHAYMPIVIEALPRPQFNAWVLSQPGGTLGGAAPAATSPSGEQRPESALPGAPGAGAPPTTVTSPAPAAAPAQTPA